MKKGRFIVLYGINNLGKSTQAKKLVERLEKEGKKAIYLKYPIYDLAPSGPMLNDYLRNGNPYNLSSREAQLLYTINRVQYEETLKAILAEGTHVIAEDYSGTGICWGMGSGVEESFLKKTNSMLLKEDLAFYFTGKRFMEAAEADHKHETNNELMEKVETAHNKLATEYNWIRIEANESIEKIHTDIWNIVISEITKNSL